MNSRFVVVLRDKSGVVEIADNARRAAAEYGVEKREATGPTIGGKLWEAMLAGGVESQSVNHLAIYENDEKGPLVATIHPVMNGAHITWLILYRIDKEGSAFKSLGNRHRLGDALDAAFLRASQEIVMPHKP